MSARLLGTSAMWAKSALVGAVNHQLDDFSHHREALWQQYGDTQGKTYADWEKEPGYTLYDHVAKTLLTSADTHLRCTDAAENLGNHTYHTHRAGLALDRFFLYQALIKAHPALGKESLTRISLDEAVKIFSDCSVQAYVDALNARCSQVAP